MGHIQLHKCWKIYCVHIRENSQAGHHLKTFNVTHEMLHMKCYTLNV